MELYISKDIQKEKIRFQKIIWAVKSNLIYQEPNIPGIHHTNQKWRDLPAQKMFSIKDFFSKCDQIRRSLRIWSHLLKKSLMDLQWETQGCGFQKDFWYTAQFQFHIQRGDT